MPAGKGGVIKRITEPVEPACLPGCSSWCSYERRKNAMVFSTICGGTCQPPGKMVLFDRSWYNRQEWNG